MLPVESFRPETSTTGVMLPVETLRPEVITQGAMPGSAGLDQQGVRLITTSS